ncbi:MAG: sigma-70 family RNA polymerase sigma factor [Acidobacteria bacterium]|nr:sigma-70 family RNA polymerase sigma factor [Acidobacteriota bacterium]MBI3279253.1 sigma-70 family RNA polymerase sigma factor [Acidobacteriota bacterium]
MLLLEGLRRGDDAAYEALIARFQQPVYNLVYRLLDNPADCSDVVQEVFLKIFRNIGSFRGQSSLKTWVYRISFNEASNQRRWFTRHRRCETGLEGDGGEARAPLEFVSDSGPSAFDLASNREVRGLVDAALETLNPDFRAAVVLRDIDELSYDEIADVLHLSLGTVKSRILRGRAALRKVLSERLKPEPVLHLVSEPAVVTRV